MDLKGLQNETAGGDCLLTGSEMRLEVPQT